MDKMINYFNKHNTANITLMYSTPGEYLDSLYEQKDIVWPVKYDDMFPYSDNHEDFWTGYYTSRQSSKKFVRDGQSNMHASNYLYAEKMVQNETSDKEIQSIMEANFMMLDWMGVYQHHDAISGTARQFVADNYVYHLSKAMASNNRQQAQIIQDKIKKDLNM